MEGVEGGTTWCPFGADSAPGLPEFTFTLLLGLPRTAWPAPYGRPSFPRSILVALRNINSTSIF